MTITVRHQAKNSVHVKGMAKRMQLWPADVADPRAPEMQWPIRKYWLFAKDMDTAVLQAASQYRRNMKIDSMRTVATRSRHSMSTRIRVDSLLV